MDEKRTGDMYFSACLLAYGAEITKVDQSDPYRQKFYFCGRVAEVYKLEGITVIRIETPTLDEIENLFMCGKLMFPPGYPEALRKIKSRIHSVDENER